MKMEKLSEMDSTLCLKLNDACLYFTILVVLAKAEVKSHEKPGTLERAMTRTSASWSTGRWHTRNKWQSSPFVSSGPKMQWKEITHSMNQLEVLTKDKNNTWVKSCKESSKRESEIMVIATELLGVENWTMRPEKIGTQD